MSQPVEIIFRVEEDVAGGWFAVAEEGIVTQGETLEELRQMIRDAVDVHFEDEPIEARPTVFRLQIVRVEEEVLAA